MPKDYTPFLAAESKPFKEWTPDEKEAKFKEIREIEKSNEQLKSEPTVSPSLDSESDAKSPQTYSPEQRTFLRDYFAEEISRAKNLSELNKIYEQHQGRAYVNDHRGRDSRSYTTTKTFLIAKLRERAKQLYAIPDPQSSSELAPGSDESEIKSPPVDNILEFLRVREKELPNARFLSREHDSFLTRSYKKLGDLVAWVFQPTHYTFEQKRKIQETLKEEIDNVVTFQTLTDIYDKYIDTEFVKKRRYGTFFSEYSYSDTRTFFITQLRERARNLNESLPYSSGGEHTIARSELLSHPLFNPIHEGLGGRVSSEARIKLEKSQEMQLDQVHAQSLSCR